MLDIYIETEDIASLQQNSSKNPQNGGKDLRLKLRLCWKYLNEKWQSCSSLVQLLLSWPQRWHHEFYMLHMFAIGMHTYEGICIVHIKMYLKAVVNWVHVLVLLTDEGDLLHGPQVRMREMTIKGGHGSRDQLTIRQATRGHFHKYQQCPTFHWEWLRMNCKSAWWSLKVVSCIRLVLLDRKRRIMPQKSILCPNRHFIVLWVYMY